MEKETEELQLNQAFEQFMHSNYSGGQITKGFVLGAMKYGYMLGKKTNYTEEEVIELLKMFAPHIRYNHKELPHTWSQVVQEWFAENKK